MRFILQRIVNSHVDEESFNEELFAILQNKVKVKETASASHTHFGEYKIMGKSL